MELLLSSPLTTPSPSSSSRKNVMLKHPFLSEQSSLTFSNIKRFPDARKPEFPRLRAQASESVQASRKPDSRTADAVNQEIRSKDENLVFVAGATGKVGSRTVRELLKLGFRVRAGVRSAQRAQTLVQSVKQLKLDDGASAVEKLEIVECDLEQDRIEPAIANASVVICCIGASEKEVFDITGPYRIDYQATKNLIDAATVAGVNHFILLTSLGTNKIGFPAAILNLFWGVLIWKRKAEEALIASGLPYTIVRPGGMERPTDTYKETHNVSLAKEDTLFGGQVSNLQVAELLAFMTKNRELSYCKVVEVIAETTTPLTPFGELLSKLPSQRVDSSSLKEPQTARKAGAAPPQSSVPVATSSVVEKEPTKTKGQTVRPSSYILYEDLKPPSSPTPTPSTSQAAATGDSNAQEIILKPVSSDTQDSSMEPTKSASAKEFIQNSGTLSPYVAYEDLKPPTSPTPTSSNHKNGSVVAVKPEKEALVSPSGDNAVTEETPTKLVEKILTEVSTQKTSYLSPYPVYDDLKPPASPSPGAPRTVSPLSTSTTDAVSQLSSKPDTSVAQDATSEKVEDKKHVSESKPRPLSPFTMYEDLKPPSSPSPGAQQTIPPLSSSTTDAQFSPKPDASIAEAAKSDKVENKKHFSESKPRPLSPFTMYEDLKPPSSPVPSPK